MKADYKNPSYLENIEEVSSDTDLCRGLKGHTNCIVEEDTICKHCENIMEKGKLAYKSDHGFLYHNSMSHHQYTEV
jgi:hypothetical protein